MSVNKVFLFNGLLALCIWIVWAIYTLPDSLLILQHNWPISLTMIFGSFIAGATSEGGGAIAFPVFTKVLHITPQDAKVFSLAIQSIGMSAATFTLLFLRIKVDWRIIIWASLGGLIGVGISATLIAPFLEPNLLKMLFTAMIVSFAVALVLVNWNARNYNDYLPVFSLLEKTIIGLTGFFGGIMTGLIGNGIDIICFSVMVLLFHLPERVSTPTSVILMAINSLFGFALHAFIIGGFTPQVQIYWLAAIPFVVVGAPLGAYFCTRLKNRTIAKILIVLIMLEFISSMSLLQLSDKIINISLGVFFLFSLIYYRMNKVKRYQPTYSDRQNSTIRNGK